MSKKYFGTGKNDKANMPQDVVNKSYAKKRSAIKEDSYIDTQEGLDAEFNKMLKHVRR